MASSAKTENFALNQWAAEDPVLREDFNADNLIIDGALKRGCKMALGILNGCDDMRLFMGSIEVDFIPKVVYLWQTEEECPWYTVIPMTAGSTTAVCARVGGSETGILQVSFLNGAVSWAPSGDTPDNVRNTRYRFLIFG